MNACDFIVVEGSQIYYDSGLIAFTHLEKCKKRKGKLTDKQADDFDIQCTLDVPKRLYAEDYNNWGCCLAWKEGCEKAVPKFELGLEAVYNGKVRNEDTKEALEYNLGLCRPELWVAEAEAEEIDETELLFDEDEDLAIG